jgi:membrane protein YdbS with pleckstrin-like domain
MIAKSYEPLIDFFIMKYNGPKAWTRKQPITASMKHRFSRTMSMYTVLKLAAWGVCVAVALQVIFYFVFQTIGHDSYLLSITLIVSVTVGKTDKLIKEYVELYEIAKKHEIEIASEESKRRN